MCIVFSSDGDTWCAYRCRVGLPSDINEGAASLSGWGPTRRPSKAAMPGAGCCVRMKALRLYDSLASFVFAVHWLSEAALRQGP